MFRGTLSGPNYFLDPTTTAQVSNAVDAEPPPGATISNADLAIKLQERQAAKARRDFAASDAIRSELESLHGIKCVDNTRSWIANDGRRGNLTGPDFFSLVGTPYADGGGDGGAGGGGGAYGGAAMAAAALPPGAMPTETLFAKIAEREQARQARDYPKSDSMRDELRRAGVNIDDKTRVWTASDGRHGTISGGQARMAPPGIAAGGGNGAHAGGYGAPPPPMGGAYGYGPPPPGGGGAAAAAAAAAQQQAAYVAYYQQQQQAYAAYYGQPPPPSGYGGGAYPGYPGY